MGATALVAIYAAVIATAGLGWQIYAWGRTRRTQMNVSINNAVFGLPMGVLGGVTIEATNRSDHEVRVTSAGFDLQDGSGRKVVIVRQMPGSSIPGNVPPHDSGMTWIEEDEARHAGLDIYKPLVGWVSTSTGESFKSKPMTLRVP
jgi:hypothetical protein